MTACGVKHGLGVRVAGVHGPLALLSHNVVGVTGTISIQVIGGGFHKFDVWLSDSKTDPKVSAKLPSESSKVRWEGVTDSNGQYEITVKHTGSANTWYLWGTFQPVSAPDDDDTGMTVGV